MSITTTIEQAEFVANKLGLKTNYECIMSGGESVILVSESRATKICKDFRTSACSLGKNGKHALTNLGKFL